MSDPLCFGVRLPAHPVSVGVARAVIRSLATHLPPERAEAAVLVLSELVTNSIQHGSTSRHDQVEVEIELAEQYLSGIVRDGGPPFELPSRPPDPGRAGGFGLHIASTLSLLSVDHTGDGNRVAFTVSIPP